MPTRRRRASRPGATIRLRAWLMPPAPMAVPGAYDFARAAWFQQIGGDRPGARHRRPAPRRRTQRLRGDDSPTGASASPPISAAGSARARRGGHRRRARHRRPGGIPEADAEAMRRSGLAHLLSVSGLHLTAVVGAVDAADARLLALSPALALALPPDPGRRRRGRARRHRLHLADRRRGADRPLLHRRPAGPCRHRASAARR